MALNEAEREFLKAVINPIADYIERPIFVVPNDADTKVYVTIMLDERLVGVLHKWINSEHGDLLAAKLAYDKEKGGE